MSIPDRLEPDRHNRSIPRPHTSAIEDVVGRITDALFGVDVDWRFTYLNPAAERMAGSSNSVLIGRSLWDVFPEFLGTVVETQCRRAMTERVSVRFEAHHPNRGWYEVDAYPSPEGLSVLCRDIDERKAVEYARVKGWEDERRAFEGVELANERLQRAEELAQDAVQRMRNTFESISDGLILLDSRWRITYINPQGERFVSHSSDELFGRDFWECFPDTVGSTFEREYRRALDQQVTVTFEEYYPPLQGWFEVHACPTREGLAIYFQNISNRKEAEAEVQRLQGMLQAILVNAPASVWIKDSERRYIMVNPHISALFGIPEEHILGKTNEDLALADESIRAMREQDEMVLRSRRPYLFESVVPIGGELRTLLSSKFPLMAPDGSVYAIGGIILDITERKKLEQQYLHAQKMEGIGRLAGGIAHDFNNLLTVILGYAELVESGLEIDTEMAANVHNIQTAATRAATLTRQLLAFARRDANRPTVFCPNDMLQNMSAMLRPLIGEQISLEMRLAHDAGWVKADTNQIEQAIVNLVVNACDAMPQGGTLVLQTQNVILEGTPLQETVTVVPGSYVMLAVTDTGTGMTAEVKAHLFEPFYSTKAVGKGTGLGLATCYGIVKQNNGYIWVYSEENLGTTVKVYLPLVTDVAPSAETQTVQGEASRGTETVLVVEDEDLVRELTVGTLQAHGYAVLEAPDGVKALQIAAEYPGAIHLLLSDMVMPNMGGLELASRLRLTRPEAKILLVSGYSEEAFSANGALPPNMVLLQKPFRSLELLAMVRSVLEAEDTV